MEKQREIEEEIREKMANAIYWEVVSGRPTAHGISPELSKKATQGTWERIAETHTKNPSRHS